MQGDKERIEMCYVCVLIPQDECNYNVLQTHTDKSKIK